MFPIGDDDVRGAGPAVSTWGLLIVNVLVFLFRASLSTGALGDFITTYGVIPREIVSGVYLHTLLTSMLLHGGLAASLAHIGGFAFGLIVGWFSKSLARGRIVFSS